MEPTPPRGPTAVLPGVPRAAGPSLLGRGAPPRSAPHHDPVRPRVCPCSRVQLRGPQVPPAPLPAHSGGLCCSPWPGWTPLLGPSASLSATHNTDTHCPCPSGASLLHPNSGHNFAMKGQKFSCHTCAPARRDHTGSHTAPLSAWAPPAKHALPAWLWSWAHTGHAVCPRLHRATQGSCPLPSMPPGCAADPRRSMSEEEGGEEDLIVSSKPAGGFFWHVAPSSVPAMPGGGPLSLCHEAWPCLHGCHVLPSSWSDHRTEPS